MFLEEFSSQDKSLGRFATAVNNMARLLWRDEITGFEFIDNMVSIINIQFRQAWAEGAATCGITPDEFTSQEVSERERFINSQLAFLPGLADFILENNRESGALFGSLSSRTGIWINRYAEAVERAQGMACANEKRMWMVGPTEHCQSCKGFNGRVYRLSVWEENGAIPRTRQLCCGGHRCQCQRVPTTAKITPGRFPRGLLCG
jgi:hypothetical protein